MINLRDRIQQQVFRLNGLWMDEVDLLNTRLNISKSHMYHYYSNRAEPKLDAIKNAG